MLDFDQSASDRIFPRQAIVSARACPEHIRACGDVPWHYAGDIAPGRPRSGISVICKCCAPRLNDISVVRPTGTLMYVDIAGTQWITSDLLEITVYWGRCTRCGAVHWAKQGPPFTRLMRYCPVSVG